MVERSAIRMRCWSETPTNTFDQHRVALRRERQHREITGQARQLGPNGRVLRPIRLMARVEVGMLIAEHPSIDPDERRYRIRLPPQPICSVSELTLKRLHRAVTAYNVLGTKA
jgi:hypothetical protein